MVYNQSPKPKENKNVGKFSVISNLLQPHLAAQKVRDTNDNKRRNTVQSFLTPTTRKVSSRNSIAYTADEIVKTLQKFQDNIADKITSPEKKIQSAPRAFTHKTDKPVGMESDSESIKNSDSENNELEEKKVEDYGSNYFDQEEESRIFATREEDDLIDDNTRIILNDFHKASAKKVLSVRWSNDDDYAVIGCDDGQLLVYSRLRS